MFEFVLVIHVCNVIIPNIAFLFLRSPCKRLSNQFLKYENLAKYYKLRTCMCTVHSKNTYIDSTISEEIISRHNQVFIRYNNGRRILFLSSLYWICNDFLNCARFKFFVCKIFCLFYLKKINVKCVIIFITKRYHDSIKDFEYFFLFNIWTAEGTAEV